MPSYLWKCETCGDVERIYRMMKDCQLPPNLDPEEDCEHVWVKCLEMPKVLKESFVSGQRMKNDQTYANMAKASQLYCDSLDHRPESVERKEMEKEIRVLKGQTRQGEEK